MASSTFNYRYLPSNVATVEPLIKDPPRKGRHLYKGHSEKRATSEIRTEAKVSFIQRFHSIIWDALLHAHQHACACMHKFMFMFDN